MGKRIFCNTGCKEGWIEDMRQGIIYPAVKLADGTLRAWRAHHVEVEQCPYCRSDLEEAQDTETVLGVLDRFYEV